MLAWNLFGEAGESCDLEICTQGGEGGSWRGMEGQRIEGKLISLGEVKLTSTDLLADLRPLLSRNLDAHVVCVW